MQQIQSHVKNNQVNKRAMSTVLNQRLQKKTIEFLNSLQVMPNQKSIDPSLMNTTIDIAS
jgi:hypothetical protein